MNTKVYATSVSNRNHGIDLLRIISMCMVVILHLMGHGKMLEETVGGVLCRLVF